MKKILLITFLLFNITLLLYSSPQEVFAPFVSRLKVTVEDSSIKLTWKDSEDVEGEKYLIYRHTEEITEENFETAVLMAQVEPGVEYYVDHPLERVNYFYAVLIQNIAGKIYKLFIPFRNKTIKGVAVKTLATEEQLAAVIKDISTQVVDDSVLVSFISSKQNRNLIVYRSTSQLRSKEDLVNAYPIRTLDSTKNSFRDFPVPGIPCHYGIIDAGLVRIGKISFTPGENTTEKPVELPLGLRVGLPERTISTRSIPLPLLPISIAVGSGRAIVPSPILHSDEKKQLSPATTKAVNSILSSISIDKPPEQEPQLLEADKAVEESGGEEYTLKTILTHEFAEKRWKDAERLLKNFLSVHHSEDVELRARYYLGQVYYFLEEYRKAFMEFLLVRDRYYTQTKPWMDAIFRKLWEEEDGKG